MKIIKVVTARCRCDDKLNRLRAVNDKSGLPAWALGTIVQCDCDVYYTLAEDQRDGFYWRKSTASELKYVLKPDVLPSPAGYTFHEAS